MGKVTRIKGDLEDVEALFEIIGVLKDVATNRFFAFTQQKLDFSKFLEIFLGFFGMLESVETDCPLIRNNQKGLDIVLISSEASFMAQLNSRVCSAVAKECEKNPEARVICVGWRGAEKCRQLGLPVDKIYRDIDMQGRYEISLLIRDYLIDRMISGASGKAICIYIWAKSFSILKPRIVTLLPAQELLGGTDEEEVPEPNLTKEKTQQGSRKDYITESGIDSIMKVLADIWISCRLFEILMNTKLAEAASQAQQLESSLEGLSKEKKGLSLSLKKATREDLNKAMAEVFSSSKMIKAKRK